MLIGEELYGYFMRQNDEISHEKILTWLRKGNLKSETEPLLIAVKKQYHKDQLC